MFNTQLSERYRFSFGLYHLRNDFNIEVLRYADKARNKELIIFISVNALRKPSRKFNELRLNYP